MKKIFTFLTLFLLFNNTYSQVIRCYTDENDLEMRALFPEFESRDEFENWLQSEMNSNSNSRIIGGVFQIPVVFHVIHNGENIGVGTNISYAAIQSQIDVLNEDFRRILNSNGYNTNPVGADTEIEFCLARRRPDGSAFPNGEHGVNRINRNTAGFTAPPYSSTYMNSTIKTYTYNNGNATDTRGWLPSTYMNIWTANLSNGLLGYAQFPQSPIGGMNCTNQNVATDGVVFRHNSVGKSSVTGFVGPYNEGRTATHEVGHWLGLRHIWGDGDCTVDDFCNDTPVAGAANYGCPSGTNSCTSSPENDMIENYMDYTDDLCMNIFTNDQKMRMRIVLESTPLRRSLINSDACIPPNENDLSVIDILNPIGDNCPGTISPSVVIKNRGTNNLSSAQISYQLNNGQITNFTYAGNLASGQTATVILPEFTSYLGNHSLKVYSTLPNGVQDPSPEFDTMQIIFTVSNGITAPFVENFEANVFPPNIKWVVTNENSDCYKWLGAAASSISGVSDNNAAQFPGFGNTSGGRESLITPIFILPCNASSANIQFDVAYRRRNNTTSNYERLFIEISENCGLTWNTTPIYDKTGTSLQVLTQTTTSYYIPVGASDWRTETIDLSSFISSESKNIKFRIRAVAANGNNIYLDNFRFNAVSSSEIIVSENTFEVFDEGGVEYGIVSVGESKTKTFTVQNTGTGNLILGLPIEITGSAFSLVSSNLTGTILPGESQTFSVQFTPPNSGIFSETLSFSTNDCDEETYNFLLNGSTASGIILVDFDANSIISCVNSTINFTNISSAANSYFWDFGPNASPETSTEENPSVSFNSVGSYSVSLTVTNEFGSNSITKTNFITINPDLVPSISITSTDADNSICQTTAISFESTIENGGNEPIFDWKINNISTGQTGSIFTTSILENGDLVSCDLISSELCLSQAVVSSSSIAIEVIDFIRPKISISSDAAANEICEGELIVFTATVLNEGISPTYQWLLNGNPFGNSDPVYSSSNMSHNDQISCLLITSGLCLNEPIQSNQLDLFVNSLLDPSIAISSSHIDNEICAGEEITFTTQVQHVGSSPSFQWFVNGVNFGSNSLEFSSADLLTDDVVSCLVTSSSTCASMNTAYSNELFMIVNQLLSPEILISSSDLDNSICSGESVTFSSTIQNGGDNPIYQWKVNGNNVGNSTSSYTTLNLTNNSTVICTLTSSESCVSVNSINSNSIVTSVSPNVTPYVTISSNDFDNIINEGTSVIFTANSSGGGSSPSYQWRINGQNVGTNSINYTTDLLQNGDVVSCVMTSSASCVNNPSNTSNTITMTVLGTNSLSDFENITSNVLIYPNPSSSNFVLKFNSKTSTELIVKITDLSGKTIEELIVHESESQLNFGENYQQGMYNLILINGNYSKTLKVVKN
jgi:PKD repeat protein